MEQDSLAAGGLPPAHFLEGRIGDMRMNKLPVRIRLRDKEYAQKMEEYLLGQYGERMEIGGEGSNSVVITDQAEDTEGSGILLNFDNDMAKGVSAYQSMDEIARMVLKQGEGQGYAQTEEMPEKLEEAAGQYSNGQPFPGLIGVFSPVGGCGKTTFSIAYCEAAAQKYPGKKILYWNAEGAADWQMFFWNPCPYTMSDLIYCLLMGEENMQEYLREIAVGQDDGTFFIKPCTSFQDLNVLEGEELNRLLKVLTTYFDLVICDMNTAFENINRQILRLSQTRYYLVSDMPGGRLKLQDFAENLQRQNLTAEYMEKGSTVVCIGDRGEEWKLPEAWKGADSVILPWCSRLFYEEGGRLRLRRDSNYYERIRQLV